LFERPGLVEELPQTGFRTGNGQHDTRGGKFFPQLVDPGSSATPPGLRCKACSDQANTCRAIANTADLHNANPSLQGTFVGVQHWTFPAFGTARDDESLSQLP
jgi:hypothetical protein